MFVKKQGDGGQGTPRIVLIKNVIVGIYKKKSAQGVPTLPPTPYYCLPQLISYITIFTDPLMIFKIVRLMLKI